MGSIGADLGVFFVTEDESTKVNVCVGALNEEEEEVVEEEVVEVVVEGVEESAKLRGDIRLDRAQEQGEACIWRFLSSAISRRREGELGEVIVRIIVS